MNCATNQSAVLQSQRDCVIQPRVARHELPWVYDEKILNPNGVGSRRQKSAATPLGLWGNDTVSQGSSCVATLGWKTESLWDSALKFPKNVCVSARENGCKFFQSPVFHQNFFQLQ